MSYYNFIYMYTIVSSSAVLEISYFFVIHSWNNLFLLQQELRRYPTKYILRLLYDNYVMRRHGLKRRLDSRGVEPFLTLIHIKKNFQNSNFFKVTRNSLRF